MSNQFIAGKNILFISVKLFNYENIIADKLRALGATVDYYDERPNNSIITKGIIRLKRDLYKQKIINYYKSILSAIQHRRYDYFFLIKGEVIPPFFIEQLKESNPDIILLYYTFDSFANNPNGISILSNFDRKFTFDRIDSQTYGLEFRPLFFSDHYKNITSEISEIDLLFIGTAHSDRYIISENLVDWCKDNNLNSFAFYYSPSKLSFWFFKFFDSSFKKFNYSKLSFVSLKHPEIISLYSKSKVILDINHPNQNGLTMRVFESLGASKKIITTNKDIANYPFYDTNNVLIIDRNNITVNKDFFEKPFKSIDRLLYEKMSIDGWVKDIFFNKNINFWNKQN